MNTILLLLPVIANTSADGGLNNPGQACVCTITHSLNAMIDKVYVKVSLLFGTISAILIMLYFFAFYFLGVNPLLHMSRFDILIMIICMTFAILYYRNILSKGKLHFGEALLIGTIINFTGTLLSTVAIYIFIAFLDTKVLNRHIAYMKNFLISTRQQMDENLGKETVERVVKSVLATTPADIALDMFIKKFFICLLATGVIGAFLRKT